MFNFKVEKRLLYSFVCLSLGLFYLCSFCEALESSSEVVEGTRGQTWAINQILMVKKIAESSYPFKWNYSVPGMTYGQEASREFIQEMLSQKKVRVQRSIFVPYIGSIQNRYSWNQSPDLDASIPIEIKDAAVRLPDTFTFEQYEKMRRLAQSCAMEKKDFSSDEEVAALAFSIGGVIVEATLPYKAKALLRDHGGDVFMHCIFQSGVNFGGIQGGGLPIPDECIDGTLSRLPQYVKKNIRAAFYSAENNESDVLVYNLGIGIGFFGGDYKFQVKQVNIREFIEFVQDVRSQGRSLEIIIPNIGYSEEQFAKLTSLGVHIIDADKDAVAALCARKQLKVSVTIAADPMSILGIHGPGLWWETAGAASDEERAAYLSRCYDLGYIPIEVYSSQGVQKIAAISEFMID